MRTTKSDRTKVLYRRISDCPELVEMVDKAIIKAAEGSFNIKGFFLDAYGVTTVDKPLDGAAIVKKESITPAVVEDNGMVKALLDDVERLTKELEVEKSKVKRALDMDLDDKGRLGWKLYFGIKEGTMKSEHDQT